MKKIIYIIPGFTENTGMKSYQKVSGYFLAKNFEVRKIKITWKRKVMSDHLEEFLAQVKHPSASEVYLLGFSFGAMIALMAAEKVKPNGLLLCSLSPYFKEDLPHIKNWWKNSIGKRRVKNFQTISFEEIAKTVNCRTILFAGMEEGEHIDRRVSEAAKKIKNSELHWIEGSKHDLGNKDYLRKVSEVIEGL